MSATALPSASTAAMNTVSPLRLPYEGTWSHGQRTPGSINGRRASACSFEISRSIGTSTKRGSARVLVAIVIGQLLGLDHEVHRVSGQERLFVEVEGLQQVQHLEDGEALRRRRRLIQRDAAVAADQRLAPARVLQPQVVLREEAALGGDEAGQRGADLTGIEAGGAFRCDGLQGSRQTAIAQQRA
jgi:hypothetical protein